MGRRRDAVRWLQKLANLGLKPHVRAVALVMLAHADGKDCVAVPLKTLMFELGYGQRHLIKAQRTLEDSGVIRKADKDGRTVVWQFVYKNSAAPSETKQPTVEDAFHLQGFYAEHWDLPPPKTPLSGPPLLRVFEAITTFGYDDCECAIEGHKQRCDRMENHKYSEFIHVFKFDWEGQDKDRLDRAFFQQIAQEGFKLRAKRIQGLRAVLGPVDVFNGTKGVRTKEHDEGAEKGLNQVWEVLKKVR